MLKRHSFRLDATTINVSEGDIAKASTAAVVNAANESSFTHMDGGVSGALRNACGMAVVGLEKNMWDDVGNQLPPALRVPRHHAGAHAAAGRLASNGVKYIVHAVGPAWHDYDVDDALFDAVCPLVYATVKRALMTASRCGASSVTLPSISGGIFTHRHDAELQEREQVAARHELFRAIEAHIKEGGSSLQEIVLIDLPQAHPASRLDLLLGAAAECEARQLEQRGQRGQPVSEASPTVGNDVTSEVAQPAQQRRPAHSRFKLCSILALAMSLGLASLQHNGISDGTLPMLHLTSEFGLRAEDVPSMRDKTALVTGASSGLGLGVARLLLRKAATLIITCRDQAKCAATVAELRANAGAAADVHCVPLELLSLASVEASAIEIVGLLKQLDKQLDSAAGSASSTSTALDMLVLNAGIMNPPSLELSPNGIESQFATNHVLLPRLDSSSSVCQYAVLCKQHLLPSA